MEANVLKALAAAPDLANQPMTTTTVYGVVTLSGSVQTEALRTEAETIASRTAGVQKVIDEMTLNANAVNPQAPDLAAMAAGGQETNPTLQSDGTMAPQPPQGTANAQGSPNQASGPDYGPGAPEYRAPYNPQQAPSQQPAPAQAANGQAQGNYPGGYGPPRDMGSRRDTRSSSRRAIRSNQDTRPSRAIRPSRVMAITRLLSPSSAGRRQVRW